MINKNSIKAVKKSVLIPMSVRLFAFLFAATIVFLTQLLAKTTSILPVNFIITSLLLFVIIRWTEKNENIERNTIKTIIRNNLHPSFVKRKIKVDSIILSTAITIGYCFSNRLSDYPKWLLLTGLSVLLLYIVYNGFISRYRFAILIRDIISDNS